MTRDELSDFVIAYLDNLNPDFAAQMDTFIQTAEDNITTTVRLPSARKKSAFEVTAGTSEFLAPSDMRAVISLSVTSGLVSSFLRPVEPDFLRVAFPASGPQGVPTRYAFADGVTVLIGPPPNATYVCNLEYEKRPGSLTAETAGTWLSENAPQALKWGTIVQGYIWMKGDTAVLAEYKEQLAIAVGQLKMQVDGRQRKDDFRDGTERV